MTLQNNKLQITELDFDQIMQNLQAYMQGQTVFSDYNFTGSGLQALLRELSYNTHYGAYYLNMLASEMHISTAIVRDNIIKLAKALNYLPGSMTAPTAIVNLVVTPNFGDTTTTLLLPRYTSFQSQAILGRNYTYLTTSSYTATLANGQFVFANVAIQEGDVVNFTYVATPSNPRNSFPIPNANIDTDTLLVNVTENSPAPPNTIPYILAADISLLDGNSRVYFLEPSDSSTYNLYFGDGVFGRSLTNGDTVNTTYLVTHGDASNQANGFTLMDPIGGFGNTFVDVISSAGGGSLAETNSSIKQNSPLSYTTQERAVTIQDYNFLLNRDYANIGSMAMWGGDKNSPPMYGTLFMSIKPKIGNYLSNVEKLKILNILAKYNMPTVIPRIIDPDYTYMLFNVLVNYNPNLTTTSPDQLKAYVRQAIIDYSNNQLGKFNGTYRESSITTAINALDPSIMGSHVNVFLQKRIFPLLGQSETYTMYFNTPLLRGGLLDKLYSSPAVIFNDSSGISRNCLMEENINTYQGINSFAVNNPGFGYTGQPDVVITGDGLGAEGHVVIVNGTVQSVILDKNGEGYNFANATVIGGGGYGAVVTPIVASEVGILQTYYFTNISKNIINTLQGTVNHVTGVVTLNDFNPVDIDNETKQLTINVRPESDPIIPSRNTILLVDPTDPVSIIVELLPQIT